MRKFMLDTNTIIFTMNNKPEKVREAFKQHQEQLCISSVTLMELVYGAEKSSQVEKNLRVLEGFVARLEVLPFDDNAAQHTGQIRAELAVKGTPIGAYEAMIAGHARSLGLIVVTNNSKEFLRVDGLRCEDWIG